MENKEKIKKVKKAINTLVDFCVVDNASVLNGEKSYGGVDCRKCFLNIKNPKYDETKEISVDNLPEICEIDNPIFWYSAKKKLEHLRYLEKLKYEEEMLRKKAEMENSLLSI